jgi:ketosteroid isomerase-like protein
MRGRQPGAFFSSLLKREIPLRGRRRMGMKTVIRSMIVVLLLFVGTQVPSQMLVPSVAAADSFLPSLVAKEQEVRAFFNQYTERYNKKDLEEFLSLFSLKARQNQQDGLPEIRMIYTALFNRSRSLQLSLEDMKIEIYQNAVEVRARYSVNQVLKEGGEKKFWKGDARWILTKEDEKLQILSVDYQYSVPPTVAGETTPEPLPLLATEEEVQQFFSSYFERYHRKDLDGFLLLFSPKAVQNQRDDFEKIRSIYAKFFEESRELRYQVEGMKTEIYQNRVEVKARFRIDQTLKKGKKEVVWLGNIRWVLGREDGALRVLSLDYQNEKPL